MRRFFIILILALSLGQVSAQDGFNFPVKSDFPIINLDEFLTDEISVDRITYLPTYIADDEQQVVHYLDYNVMEWSYIDYPDNETQASVRAEYEGGISIRSGDFKYNLETEKWEDFVPDNSEDIYDYTVPDNFCGRSIDRRQSDVWNIEESNYRGEYDSYTFCNAITDEEYTIDTFEVGEVCEMSDATYSYDYANDEGNLFFLFFGVINNRTRLCMYDIGNRQYTRLGDTRIVYDHISWSFRENDVVILEGKLDLEVDQYGLPTSNGYAVVDLIEINLNSKNGVRQITKHGENEIIIVTGGYYFTGNNRERAFKYMWAEPLSDTEEAIYFFTNETPEPQLLFTRKHENLGFKFYEVSISPSKDYVRIQEPHIYRSGLDGVSLHLYTVDGKHLHTEEFDFPYPHDYLTYWLDEITTVVLPQDYANPYSDLMKPLTVIHIGESNQVNTSILNDYKGIYGGGAYPFPIDDSYYFAILYDDSVQLYDIGNNVLTPLITTPPMGELCFHVEGGEESIYIDVWQDCKNNGSKVFRVVLDVSINPSGD